MVVLVADFTTVSVEVVLVTFRSDDSGEMIRKVFQFCGTSGTKESVQHKHIFIIRGYFPSLRP